MCPKPSCAVAASTSQVGACSRRLRQSSLASPSFFQSCCPSGRAPSVVPLSVHCLLSSFPVTGQLPGALADMLRQQQQRGQLPAQLAEMLRRHDAAAAAAAQPGAAGGGAAAQAPRPFPRLVVRLNMRALLQLLVLMVVVYQHCPPGRFLILVGVGLLLYLTATEPVRRFLNRLAGVQPPAPAGQPQPRGPPQQQGGEGGGEAPAAPAAPDEQQGAAAPPAPAAGDAAAAGRAPAAAAPGAAEAARAAVPAGDPLAAQQGGGGILREVQALVVGFFTSLIPGMCVCVSVSGCCAPSVVHLVLIAWAPVDAWLCRQLGANSTHAGAELRVPGAVAEGKFLQAIALTASMPDLVGSAPQAGT